MQAGRAAAALALATPILLVPAISTLATGIPAVEGAPSVSGWNVVVGAVMTVLSGAFWLLWQRIRIVERDAKERTDEGLEALRRDRQQLWDQVNDLRKADGDHVSRKEMLEHIDRLYDAVKALTERFDRLLARGFASGD